MIETDVLIIGAGLTGLTLQYLLRNESYDVQIVEARDRLGGRILSRQNEAGPPIEMGATWIQQQHTSLIRLLKELNIDTFPQEMGTTAIYEADRRQGAQLVPLPPNPSPSRRIKNGTSNLINQLASFGIADKIHLNEEVQSISEDDNYVIVKSSNKTFTTKIVITTLPPYLLKQTVTFDPALPQNLLDVMQDTHTWMGESIKVGLVYKTPFWRDPKTSGTIFSNVGPVTEFYDHRNFEDNLFGLMGFISNNHYTLDKSERLDLILNQLRKYYGDVVDDFGAYNEVVWREEKYTYREYDKDILPHQNNGHPAYQSTYMGGKLIVGGAETANRFGGYMEGAVVSARSAFEVIQGVGLGSKVF